MVYNEPLTMNYIDSVTVAVLESDFRGQLLPEWSNDLQGISFANKAELKMCEVPPQNFW